MKWKSQNMISKILSIWTMKEGMKLDYLLKNHMNFCQIITLFKRPLLKLYNSLKNEIALLKKYIFVEQRRVGITERVENIMTMGNCHYIAHLGPNSEELWARILDIMEGNTFQSFALAQNVQVWALHRRREKQIQL